MSVKKEKVSSYLICIVSLSRMTGKTESFSGKISWIWSCSHISRKFSYWENLLLFRMMLNKASVHFYTLENNIYTSKNSPTNIHLLIVNNSNTKKRCEICSKLTIKTPERCSTVFIVSLNIFQRCWLNSQFQLQSSIRRMALFLL